MRRSRLSQYNQNKLTELFVAGVTARTAAQFVGVNKNTAAYYFYQLRLLIFHSSPHLEMFDAEVEADESYFGRHRKSRRGYGSAGKVDVFRLSTVRFIPLPYPIRKQPPCCLLFVSK